MLSGPAVQGGARDRMLPAAMAAVLLVALALRMAVLLRFAPWLPSVQAGSVVVDDASTYHELAQCLLQWSFCDNTVRTPGYPMFVAAVYALVGVKPWAVLVLQAFVDLGTIALTYAMGRRLFSERAGLFGAALLAVEPTTLLASSNLLTDSLFTLLIVAALYAVVRARQAGRWLAGGLGAGLLLGLATLVRPVGQYLPLVLLPLLLWPAAPQGACLALRHRAGMAVLMAAAFALTLAPWLARNQQAFGQARLSTVQGEALLNWHVAYQLAWRHGKPVDAVRKELRAEVQAAGASEDGEPFRNDAIAQQIAARHIRADLQGFLMANLRGISFMYLNVGTRRAADKLGLTQDDIRGRSLRDAASFGAMVRQAVAEKPLGVLALGTAIGVLQGAGYLLAIAGCWMLWRRREHLWGAALALVMVLYFSATAGAIGEARYRMPATPGYLLLGGLALAHLAARSRRRPAASGVAAAR